MAYQWVDCDRSLITQRYDRIARLIPFFEWLLFLPAGLRRKAVESINLKPGDRVLEIGCGTGRNFSFLRDAVGPTGGVYGVDLSAGMLQVARDFCDRNGWTNFHLTESDAGDYIAPQPLDGVLFSLSYNTIPHHRRVLQLAWKQLRPGGTLVIMDAKLPPGRGGQAILPFSVWLMKNTLLGNPYIKPWDDVSGLSNQFTMKEFLFGSYYICSATKPESNVIRRRPTAELPERAIARAG